MKTINWTNYEKDLNCYRAVGLATYKIGPFKFENKDNIKKFCRSLISYYLPGTRLEHRETVEFVQELYKFHPRYDKTKEFENYVNVVLNKEFPNYCNFEVVFKDQSKHNFSNAKAIANIPQTYNAFQKRAYKKKYLNN